MKPSVETAAPPQPGAVLLPELQELLERLSAEEQSLLATMIRRSKPEADGETEKPFDAVSFVHQYLKAGPDTPEFAVMEDEIAATIAPPVAKEFEGAPTVVLPRQFLPLEGSLDVLLKNRFSSHSFGTQPLDLAAVSTLLRYGYGVKQIRPAYNVKSYPIRTSPSAGGLQPIDLYLVANDVAGVDKGVYYFHPLKHALQLVDAGNFRQRLAASCIYQNWIVYAPLVFVLACNMPRVRWKYHARGYRFVHVDAGVLVLNLYLTATALKLNTCAVAAYYDDLINDLVEIDGRDEFAILLFAVGNKPQSLPAAQMGIRLDRETR